MAHTDTHKNHGHRNLEAESGDSMRRGQQFDFNHKTYLFPIQGTLM